MTPLPARCWMETLATHLDQHLQQPGVRRLMVMFDIDGTLLDTRRTIQWLLQGYDAAHGTQWFAPLDLAAIRWHEARIDDLLEDLAVPVAARAAVQAWYRTRFWTADTMRIAHAFDGAFELVRHLQQTPGIEVALNTGRPEFLRAPTLRALNAAAADHGVRFASRLLYMKRGGWEDAVAAGKAAGVEHFRAAGYRIVAMIDNEPENLAAISATDPRREILLLHADTLFLTDRRDLPGHAVAGERYDTRPFAPRVQVLPRVA